MTGLRPNPMTGRLSPRGRPCRGTLVVALSDTRRQQDGSALDAASVELVEDVGSVLERELLRGDFDLALAVELHQLGQVVVRANDVANDGELAQEQVDRLDRQTPAVADLRVRATPMQHLDRRVRGAMLADEIEDDVCALTVGDLSHRVDAAIERRVE